MALSQFFFILKKEEFQIQTCRYSTFCDTTTILSIKIGAEGQKSIIDVKITVYKSIIF